MKYYIVKAKCGHVGRNNYIEIEYPVVAHNGKEAALKVRYFPRVKHDRKDAIISVKEISYDDYLIQTYVNRYDNYLYCSSRQEQYRCCDDIEDRTMKENQDEYDYEETRKSKMSKLAKNRYSLKYIECAERKAAMREFAYSFWLGVSIIKK